MAARLWPGAFALPLALIACEPAPVPDNKAANEVSQPTTVAPVGNSPMETTAENVTTPETQVEVPEDAPGLAEMSPFRRRAYEAGYRDCRAGRYDPDLWPEAYRIGCGAAQEAR